ncbi:reverse transcriptase domain-containing protein [Tanacetum coccineum]
MTRSSTNKLYTPYKDPEREFRSSKKHFKSLSLDELRSPDFNLLSDKEYSEEEEEEAMAETMEQYMSKTRTDYGSGVARPKIDNKDQFELKGQFLKELRENTFSGSDNEDANEHIEKVLKIVDLFHVPNITVDQLMLRVFHISLTRASCCLRNEPTGLIKTGEDLKTKFLNKYCPPSQTAKKTKEINNFQQEPDETLYQAWERFKELLMKCPQHYLTEMHEVILFYNGLDVLTRQILDSRGAVPTKTAADAKTAIQEMAEYSQKWHNVNEKVYAAQVGCEQCKGPHYTKDCPQKEEGNALEEAYYTQFGGPFQGGDKATAARPFLSTARAKIDVYKRKITLRVGEEKIIFKSVKPASSIIKRVYMLSLRERMELDLEARLMGETLVLNRSLDPFSEDYIELNDLNEPFELRRNQGDDLMPTIEEGEVIEEFRTRDENLDTRIDDYPSYYDDDKKIHIDYAHNLKFSCMIGFEFTHANFFPLLYVNMMSRKFHNSIMKNKMVYKGNNVVGALMNVPIFVLEFFFMELNFAILRIWITYRDNEYCDNIFS